MSPATSPEALTIGEPRALRRGDAHRVEADLAGVPIWFESRDVALEPAPEAFASALLLPALERGLRIRSAAPLSGRWRAGVEELLPILAGWWELPLLSPEAPERRPAGKERPVAAGTASFFTRGVDSFHTLLRLGLHIDALVFVPEFDLGLEEEHHRAEAERDVRWVASELGVRAVVVRSNLRTHPLHERTVWARTHGSALAAVGHVLGASFREVLISSSDQTNADLPWGTHARTDPLWSSERMEVRHVGAAHWRREKLLSLLDEPIVRRHLRVCFQPPVDGRLNCSRCEKCIRTMAVLSSAGRLDAFECFSPAAPLAELIGTVPPLRPGHVAVWGELQRSGLPRREARAVRRLLLRTRLVRRREETTRGVRKLRRRVRSRARRARRRLRRMLRRRVRRLRAVVPRRGR